MAHITKTLSGNAIILDADAASEFKTSTGDLTIESTNGSLIFNSSEAATDSVRIFASNESGGIDIDTGGGLTLDGITPAAEGTAANSLLIATGAVGAGRSSTSSAGGAGGALTIIGGIGGAITSTGTGTAGVGANITIAAGAGGDAVVAGTKGTGGNVTISGGTIGGGTGSGGAAGIVDITTQIKIQGGTPGTDKLLQSDSVGLASWVSPGSSSIGDVIGPSSVIDNRLVLFDNTTGKLIKQSTAILDTSGIFSGIVSITIGSSTDNNTWYGFQAGDNFVASSGFRNSAFGEDALTATSSGTDNTAIGYNTLSTMTNKTNNTAIGSGALAVNTASSITAMGSGALAANTIGTRNVAVGYKALNANTDSSFQTAIGENSMLITTGSDNTAIGSNTLLNNIAGGANTALGSIALLDNISGNGNIGIGQGGGRDLTTGHNNICIGNDGIAANDGVIRIGTLTEQTNTFIQGIHGVTPAGSTQTVTIDSNGEMGSINTTVGDVVGPSTITDNAIVRFDTTTGKLIQESLITIDNNGDFSKSGTLFIHDQGTDNIGIGLGAVDVISSGQGNVGIGPNALGAHTIGNNCVAIGLDTLSASTGVVRSIAIGRKTLQSSTSTTGKNICIGAFGMDILTTGDNNVAIGDNIMRACLTGSRNVAIGSGDVMGSSDDAFDNVAVGYISLSTNIIGDSNVAVGSNSLLLSTGSNNTGIGYQSLDSVSTGTDNIALGYTAGNLLTTGNNNICIGHVGVAGNSALIRLGSTGTHTSIFIAGIASVTPAGSTETVIVDISTGELGSITTTVGDVVGPSTITNNAIATFDTTTGKLIQECVITIDDSGDFDKSGVDFLHERGGTGNLGIGSTALDAIAGGGIDNTAIGQNALGALTTGNDNTVIGSGAGSTSNSSNNIIIGKDAGTAGGSNNILIGNSGLSIDNNIVRIGNNTDHSSGVLFPSESPVSLSSGRYYLEEFYKRLPQLNASISISTNLDFEISGTNASNDDVIFDTSYTGIKLQTDASTNSEVLISPHLDTNQSSWDITKWGTENRVNWSCAIRFGSSVTNVIMWAGLKLTNVPDVSDDNNAIYFMYDSSVSSEIRTIILIAGSQFLNTSGFTATINTTYIFRIHILSDRRARFFINDTHVKISDALTDDIDFKPYIGIETLDSSAKDMTVSYQKISRLLFE